MEDILRKGMKDSLNNDAEGVQNAWKALQKDVSAYNVFLYSIVAVCFNTNTIIICSEINACNG